MAATTLDVGIVEAKPESHIVRMRIDHMGLGSAEFIAGEREWEEEEE